MNLEEIKLIKRSENSDECLLNRISHLILISSLGQASDVLILKAPLQMVTNQTNGDEKISELEPEFSDLIESQNKGKKSITDPPLKLLKNNESIFTTYQFIKHVHSARKPVSYFFYDKRILLVQNKRTFKFVSTKMSDAIKTIVKSIIDFKEYDVTVAGLEKDIEKKFVYYKNKSCFAMIQDILKGQYFTFSIKENSVSIKVIKEEDLYNPQFKINSNEGERLNSIDFISRPVRRAPQPNKPEINDVILPGDLKTMAGSVIKMDEPVTAITGHYLVTDAVHTITKGIHTMKLGLQTWGKFSGVYKPDIEPDYLKLKTIRGSLSN